jgi:ParB-like nuclease family protein
MIDVHDTGGAPPPVQLLAFPPPDWAALPALPAADLFPTLGETELEALADSIATNGFYRDYPIVLTRTEAGGWAIVDGRNRREALRLLLQRGTLTDDMLVFAELGEHVNPIAYIAAVNLKRRDLEA